MKYRSGYNLSVKRIRCLVLAVELKKRGIISEQRMQERLALAHKLYQIQLAALRLSR